MAAVPAGLATALQDRYRLDRELGHGGMATVYLAEDLKHHRRVAIKVLKPELAAVLGPERFLLEITLTAQLTHPHILPLLDSGEARVAGDMMGRAGDPMGRPYLYYVMPYVEGETLRDRLTAEKQLPLDEALRITREVADALGYAHGQGIIHRDIKPENILLESGHAVVADFGIARAVEQAGGTRLTETGVAVGTPDYMSPEQAAGDPGLDERSDLYSLGCVLYEMLAGHPPFLGRTPQEVRARHALDPVPSLRTVRTTVPAPAEAAIVKALAKVPADRYESPAAFIAGLTETPTLPTGPPPSGGPTPPRSGPLRRAWLVAGAATVVVAAAVTILLLRSHGSTAGLDPQLIAVMPFRAASPTPALRELAEQMPDIFWTKVTGEFGPRATDPATVARVWQNQGGTPEGGLPVEAELRIARTQGAGLLVRGVITGTEDTATITAQLLEVSSGQVRVPPTAVQGAAARWIPLMDSLIVLLLAKDFGDAAVRIPELARYSPRAIQAYLAGLRAVRRTDFTEAQRLLGEALEIDSTFVLTAAEKYNAGETDTVVARYAWQHQYQLPPRERARLRAQAGWLFGAARTEADVIAQWESLTVVWPEYGSGWLELGEELYWGGPLAGEPRWRERARSAFERAARLRGGATGAHTWGHLFRLAVTDTLQDMAAIQRYFDRIRATIDPRGQFLCLRWRMALHRGDTAEAAHLFSKSPDSPDPRACRMVYAIEDGLGAADADRAATPNTDRGGAVLLVWARARGRHAEWLHRRDEMGLSATRRAVLQLRDALFLGEAEDSSVHAAERLMANIAAGRISGSPPLPDRIAARCWSALWRIQHGDSVGARAAARYLHTEVALPYKFPVCAGLIELLVTREMGGDLRTAARHWDSVVHPVPVPPLTGRREDGTRGLDNLLLARLLVQVGDTAAALAAARRRTAAEISFDFNDPESVSLLVDYLREEGRLAALTGDTSGAIRAYTHYLALRTDPDYGPWRAERDEVKRELGALIGEPKPTLR